MKSNIHQKCFAFPFTIEPTSNKPFSMDVAIFGVFSLYSNVCVCVSNLQCMLFFNNRNEKTFQVVKQLELQTSKNHRFALFTVQHKIHI